MKTAARALLLLFVYLAAPSVFAQTANPAAGETCPVSLDLSNDERSAYTGFNSALSWMQNYYGTDQFQAKLNDIIAKQWPTKKVIEVSPVFMEKTLNQVDQEYLRDSIARIIGLDSQEWYDFEHTMKYVIMFGYTTENKYGAFTKKVNALTNKIKNTPRSWMKVKPATDEQADVLKGRALMQIANMLVFMGRWEVINNAIAAQRAAGAGKQFLVNTLSLTAGTLLAASILYAAPVVAGAGAVGATASTALLGDAVWVATAGRVVGQIGAGAMMGIVGAPTSLLLTDTTTTTMNALRDSANNHTIYECELDKQMRDWRNRGIAPYMKASVIGGTVGMVGGPITLLGNVGAKTLLYATSFSVVVAEAYTIGQVNMFGLQALAEYKLAMDAHDQGDDVSARMHLHASRDFSVKSGMSAVEAIVVGALSVSIAAEFNAALHDGAEAIRVIFANSTDTLPMALGIAYDSANKLIAH